MVKYNLTKVDWNNEYNWEMDVLIDIVEHYKKHKNLHIVLNWDGMDVSKSGLARVITFLENNYTCDIIIENANLLGNDVYKRNFRFIKRCQRDITLNKNITANFCMFVGRPSWDRLLLSSWLFNNANTIQTYHGSPYPTRNFEDTNNVSLGMDFDILCKRNITNVDIDGILELMKNAPVLIPHQTSGHYSSENPQLLKAQYETSFVEIVAETAKEGKVFFPTEKTFRPIMFKTPFITFGPVNFLSNLRKLGFKTFDKWFDESYDIVEDTNNRLAEVLNVMKYVNTWNLEKVRQVNLEMREILEHNHNVLMSLTSDDLNRERFK